MLTKQDIQEVNHEIAYIKQLITDEAEAVERRVGLYQNEIEGAVRRTISGLLG